MNIGRLIWGLIFVGAGLFILGTKLGWWQQEVLEHLLFFWPIILILIGLRLIVKNDQLYLLIFLVILIGIMFFAIKNPYDLRDRIENKAGSIRESENIVNENNSNMTKAKITINIGAAKMQIRGGTDGDLFRLNTENMGKIETNRTDEENATEVTIKETGYNFFNRDISKRKFALDLSEEITYDLNVNNGASTMDFDFSKLAIPRFEINSGASSGNIRIGGDALQVNGEIKAGASDIVIFVPQGYAIRIENSSALTQLKSEGLVLINNDKVSETKDFQTNGKKINLKIASGASKITVKAY